MLSFLLPIAIIFTIPWRFVALWAVRICLKGYVCGFCSPRGSKFNCNSFEQPDISILESQNSCHSEPYHWQDWTIYLKFELNIFPNFNRYTVVAKSYVRRGYMFLMTIQVRFKYQNMRIFLIFDTLIKLVESLQIFKIF